MAQATFERKHLVEGDPMKVMSEAQQAGRYGARAVAESYWAWHRLLKTQ